MPECLIGPAYIELPILPIYIVPDVKAQDMFVVNGNINNSKSKVTEL